jgi:hypothetical protein
MKLDECLDIMNITDKEFMDYDLFHLKKQYHKLAKIHHPDKGGDNIKFQQLHEAYNDLNEILIPKINHSNINMVNAQKYIDLFSELLTNKHMNDVLYRKCVCTINNIVKNFKMFCVDKLLSKNEEIIIEIKPTLNDMFINNICKYDYKDTFFLIPLWHNEIYFEYNSRDIIFICNPILPDNYLIDKYNSLHIIEKFKMADIYTLENIKIEVDQSILEIPVKSLKIVKYQTYTFHKRGLSDINIHDIYNISTKMDIVVHITIE